METYNFSENNEDDDKQINVDPKRSVKKWTEAEVSDF